MSPILVRPVREQLEHDRVIRLLQAKYKRKFEVAINPGNEQNASVMVGTSPWYPDLVLYTQERGRKLAGTVEVETAESVNNLEAMSQWKTFSQQKAPFHLYVPASSIDTARRMAANLQVPVAEIWAFSAFGDQMRFTLIHRTAVPEVKPRPVAAAEPKPRAAVAAKPAVAARAAAPARAAGSARGGRAQWTWPRRPSRSARPIDPSWYLRLPPRHLERPWLRPGPGRRRPRRGAPRRRSRYHARRNASSAAVPFLRVIRDKRGYETTYLMHWYREGNRQRSRILYVFRTPGGVRVGREALEPDVLRRDRKRISRYRLRLAGGRRKPAGRRTDAGNLPVAQEAPTRRGSRTHPGIGNADPGAGTGGAAGGRRSPRRRVHRCRLPLKARRRMSRLPSSRIGTR